MKNRIEKLESKLEKAMEYLERSRKDNIIYTMANEKTRDELTNQTTKETAERRIKECESKLTPEKIELRKEMLKVLGEISPGFVCIVIESKEQEEYLKREGGKKSKEFDRRFCKLLSEVGNNINKIKEVICDDDIVGNLSDSAMRVLESTYFRLFGKEAVKNFEASLSPQKHELRKVVLKVLKGGVKKKEAGKPFSELLRHVRGDLDKLREVLCDWDRICGIETSACLDDVYEIYQKEEKIVAFETCLTSEELKMRKSVLKIIRSIAEPRIIFRDSRYKKKSVLEKREKKMFYNLLRKTKGNLTEIRYVLSEHDTVCGEKILNWLDWICKNIKR